MRGPFCLTLVDTPAFWAFLWFVGFCYLANQWQVSKPKDNPLNEGTDAARAAIAFSFFSIFTWVSTPACLARLRACGLQRSQGLRSTSVLNAHGGAASEGDCGHCQRGQLCGASRPLCRAPTGAGWAFTTLLTGENARPAREEGPRGLMAGTEPRPRSQETLELPLIFWASVFPPIKSGDWVWERGSQP